MLEGHAEKFSFEVQYSRLGGFLEPQHVLRNPQAETEYVAYDAELHHEYLSTNGRVYDSHFKR